MEGSTELDHILITSLGQTYILKIKLHREKPPLHTNKPLELGNTGKNKNEWLLHGPMIWVSEQRVLLLSLMTSVQSPRSTWWKVKNKLHKVALLTTPTPTPLHTHTHTRFKNSSNIPNTFSNHSCSLNNDNQLTDKIHILVT